MLTKDDIKKGFILHKNKKMKYDLITEEKNYVIINLRENRPVVWINKEYATLEFALQITENFNNAP
jgi:hypothetical protein